MSTDPTIPDHECDSGNFDRTICPDPCGVMHSYCATCGKRADRCAHDETVLRVRAADLQAARYNCECQVGGVDAASVDADYLHSIGEQIDALLDALAARDAEVERLRGSADAWWTEYDRELKAHEATKAREAALREAVEDFIAHMDAAARGGQGRIKCSEVAGHLRAILAAAPSETETGR